MTTKQAELELIAVAANDNFIKYFVLNDNVYVQFRNKTIQIRDLKHLKRIIK